MTTDLFTADDIISTYSRAQALEDGVLVDANVGDLAEVTRQHFKLPVAMTASVFAVMERAVNNKRQYNDWRGVWHDVCWMAKNAMRRAPDGDRVDFQVIITGAARQKYWRMVAHCGPGDDSAPVLTFMLAGED